MNRNETTQVMGVYSDWGGGGGGGGGGGLCPLPRKLSIDAIIYSCMEKPIQMHNSRKEDVD